MATMFLGERAAIPPSRLQLQPHMTSALIERTLSVLRHDLATTSVFTLPDGEGLLVEIPPGPHAQYAFSLMLYSKGDREIRAGLVDAKGRRQLGHNGLPFSFWYHPFELEDYHNSPAELADQFDRELAAIIRAPTRIHQRRYWGGWHFFLERQAAGGQWEHVYGYHGLGPDSVPPIDGPSHVYVSPPLCGG